MTEARYIPFHGVRVHYDSAKSYDQLRAALLADIGEQPVPLNDIATDTGDWECTANASNPTSAQADSC